MREWGEWGLSVCRVVGMFKYFSLPEERRESEKEAEV